MLLCIDIEDRSPLYPLMEPRPRRTAMIITTTLYPEVGLGSARTPGPGQTQQQIRFNEYLVGISQAIRLCTECGVEPIIVENSMHAVWQDPAAQPAGQHGTILDTLGVQVLYTDSSRLALRDPARWKGIREFMDISLAINKLGLRDTDMVIKLTGRYVLLDDEFIRQVIEHSETHDVVAKYNGSSSVELGVFASKAELFQAIAAIRMFNLSSQPEIIAAETASQIFCQERILKLETLHLQRKWAGVNDVAQDV